MPQVAQGFLHPRLRGGTGKPQRLQAAGVRGDGAWEPESGPTDSAPDADRITR